MEDQARRKAIFKEVYVGLIGWFWIAAGIGSAYLLVRAIFFGESRGHFIGCAALCWLLYRVALYYKLESQGMLPVASPPWTAPPDETYYLQFKKGDSRKVHIQDRDDVDAYVQSFNAHAGGEGIVVRVISQSLQKQRLATGRDGVVWPDSTPVFFVHFSDGIVSELNLGSAEVEDWGNKWRVCGAVEITEICDTYGYVIWPERDGSRIL